MSMGWKPMQTVIAVAVAGWMSLASSAEAAQARSQQPVPAEPNAESAAQTAGRGKDNAMILRGNQEGTAFRSLTVEGEDRVHFEIERPSLELAIDPSSAPGLDWGSAADVLDRTVPDGTKPFLRASTGSLSPFLGRPWLQLFASGVVARFQPNVENVDGWRLLVADSRGQVVASFEGRGKPPREITWNGLTAAGQPAQPGQTYSYVLEARDRAGNKRNFVGQGFELPSYRLEGAKGLELVFVGDRVPTLVRASTATGTPGYVFEAASWLNQAPSQDGVRISATARSYQQANALATGIARSLTPLLLGNPSRVQVQTLVEPAAHPSGTAQISMVQLGRVN
jgi:hypothetical protein